MLKIGLCGASGSGKGAVSAFFIERGYFTIDTDKVCHELFSVAGECTKALRTEFGDYIFDSYGSVNRKKLSEVVFSDKQKLQKLNSISHFYILASVREIIESVSENYDINGVVIDAPLLFESGFDAECDCVVAVVSDKNKRVERIMNRDGISAEMAIARIKNQKNDVFLIENSDYVIENNGDLARLKRNTMCVIDNIENKFM